MGLIQCHNQHITHRLSQLHLVATAYIPLGQGDIDPVPHAMVLTGIVVSVSVTALALILACRVQETSNIALLRRTKKSQAMKETGT